MIPFNVADCRICGRPGRFVGAHGVLVAYRCPATGRLWQTVIPERAAA